MGLMPDIQLLPKLAKLFNMSVDELLDYQDVLTKEKTLLIYVNTCLNN